MSGNAIWAMGLMSGTSVDGIDAATLLTDGETITKFGASGSFDGPDPAPVLEIAKDWRAWRGRDVGAVENVIDAAQITAAKSLMQGQAVDVVGYHGQTVGHDPENGFTWQLGQGQRLADALDCDVIHDFRSNDMRAGGQGAPLAPFFHFAALRSIGATGRVACLNLGGVGNVTLCDLGKSAPEEKGALFACDTGPANALMDDEMRRETSQPFDEDGALAQSGTARLDLIDMKAFPYLARSGPKSLDRYDFHALLPMVASLPLSDRLATLAAFSAECVARTALPFQPDAWLVCGGGRRNRAIMAALDARLDAPVSAIESVGLDGDMLEAQAFAFLAVRSLRGLALSAPDTTGCRKPVTGGIRSQPAGRSRPDDHAHSL